MAVALIQGASRGIGLQFCRHILKSKPGSQVIATCRNPDTATELQTLKNENPSSLQVLQVDVTQEKHITEAAKFVKDKYGHIDLVINSAGMLHPSGRGETSLASVTAQGLMTTLDTNTIGPLMMAKHFAPLLKKGQGNFGETAVLVNMSAKVGSITDNGLGGWYSYRMSKTALNMATKNLSIELGRGRDKVICVALHPGTVDTALSRPYHKGVPEGKLFSVEYSVDCLMKIIYGLRKSDSGKYLAWDGTELPF